MRFQLESSPFRDVHKFSGGDILPYMEYRLRELAVAHRQEHGGLPLSPSALVFTDTEAVYVDGGSFASKAGFVAEVTELAAESSLVVLFAEFGSIGSASPRLVVDVQALDYRGTRAYALDRNDWWDIDTSLTPWSIGDGEDRQFFLGLDDTFGPYLGANPADSSPRR